MLRNYLIILTALLAFSSFAHAASTLYARLIKAEEVNDFSHYQNKDDWQKILPDGTEVIVRLYKNCKDSPEVFNKVPVKIKDQICMFEARSTMLAVVSEDQVYETIKQAVRNNIYTAYEKLILRFDYGNTPPKETRWFFDDALGNKIPATGIIMFLFDFESGTKIRIGKFQTDGTLSKFMPSENMESFEFVISNSKYGTAKMHHYSGIDDSHFTLPLVDMNSEAADRAIWGFVVDHDGNPVEGAEIICTHVRTLGEGAINPKPEGANYAAVTDQRGFFNMYMPQSDQDKDQRGKLIPPKSKYYVKISAPKHLGLLPYDGPLENGKESKIILERPTGKKHVLIFRDEHGTIADPNKLEQIVLLIKRKDRAQINLSYDKFKNLDLFPYGTYIAIADSHSMSGEPYEFKPLEVDEKSPRELVFAPPDVLAYCGQVVHGISGDPLPGAFVMLMRADCGGEFCSITDEQWKALHALRADPNVGDKTLMPLTNIHTFSRIVRTDSNGRFQMNTGSDRNFYGLVFFDENYFSVMWPKFQLKAAVNNRVEIPLIRLFPAAKVTIEPQIDGNDTGLWQDWIIDEQNNPDWTSVFLKSPKECRTGLRLNRINTFYVPAGLRFKLKLCMPSHSPLVLDQIIHLQQGQTLDLGKCKLQSAMAIQISARVISSAGEPVEGVPVREEHTDDGTGVHNSDANGIVRFTVPANSKGVFIISCDDPNQPRELLREKTPFDATGGNRQFTIKISDKMLDLLFK